MVIDNALRITGGARGVVQGDGIPLVVGQLPGEIGLAFVQQGLVILFAERFAAGEFRVEGIDDDRLRPFEQRQRAFDDDGEFRIGDQHLGFAVGQHEGDGFGVEAGIQGIEDGADHRHAEMALEHRCRVGQHHRDRVALADTAILQGGSQLTTTVVAFLPGVLTRPLDDGNSLRIDKRRALDKAQRGKRNIIGRVLFEPDGVRICHKYLLTILAKTLFSFLGLFL